MTLIYTQASLIEVTEHKTPASQALGHARKQQTKPLRRVYTGCWHKIKHMLLSLLLLVVTVAMIEYLPNFIQPSAYSFPSNSASLGNIGCVIESITAGCFDSKGRNA